MSEHLQAALMEKARRERARRQKGVVATTEDGGRVIRADDGSLSFTSPGFSTTDPDRIEEIMQGARPVDLVQGDFDRQIIEENPIAARGQEFVQGTPVVGEFLDEAVGVVSPRAARNMRALSDAMERQNPVESALLNVGGAISTTAPIAAGTKALDFVARGVNSVSRGLRAGAVAVPGGAVEGALSLAGRADDGDRIEEAGKGALIGGGLAAVLGPLMSLGAEGATAMARRFKKLDVRTIAEEFGISFPAARTVREALQNDDLAAAQQRLSVLGDDALLADAGPATGALLDAAANTGGTALRVASDVVGERAEHAGRRLPGVLDSIFGRPVGVKTAAREIASSTRAARNAAYDRAYAVPINYAEATGRRVEGVLDRIPQNTMRSAIAEANEAMTEAGLGNQQIIASIAEDGSVAFREMPNVMQLDFIKRALDENSRNSVDKFGRKTGAGVRAARLARDLRDAVRDAVPEYRRALRVGGDKIQQDEGLDLGKQLLFKRTTVEDVRAFLNQGVSNKARAAIRQGVRDSIEQNLSNVRRTITDPNVDAREAMALVKEMSSRANMEKLRLVLGGPRANRLLREIDRTAAALELRAAISQNSKTAIRQSISGQVRNETAPNAMMQAAGNIGNPLDAAKGITQTIVGIDPRSMTARERGIFEEISRALTGIRGQDAERALAAVRRAMIGQPIRDEEAALIGRVIAASGGIAGYQQSKRSLAQ